MPDYAVYIWSAYGVTGIAVAALVLRAVLDARAQRRALARLVPLAGDAAEDRVG